MSRLLPTGHKWNPPSVKINGYCTYPLPKVETIIQYHIANTLPDYQNLIKQTVVTVD